MPLIHGCAHLGDSENAEETPSQLMKEGTRKYGKGYYSRALTSYQKLKDRYPYSKYATKAELRIADAHFFNGEYDEALIVYKEFEKLHPKNKNIPYVLYQKGLCHFNQMSTIDRDHTHSLRAKKEFERLIHKFPKNKYADQSRIKIRDCYIKLAKYELYVGNYYFKMGKFEAAINRYRYLLENYPDLGQAHDALESMRKCKEKLAYEKDNS